MNKREEQWKNLLSFLSLFKQNFKIKNINKIKCFRDKKPGNKKAFH